VHHLCHDGKVSSGWLYEQTRPHWMPTLHYGKVLVQTVPHFETCYSSLSIIVLLRWHQCSYGIGQDVETGHSAKELGCRCVWISEETYKDSESCWCEIDYWKHYQLQTIGWDSHLEIVETTQETYLKHQSQKSHHWMEDWTGCGTKKTLHYLHLASHERIQRPTQSHGSHVKILLQSC